jgi:hypothetical protein
MLASLAVAVAAGYAIVGLACFWVRRALRAEGMRLYAELAANASVCASCPAPCLGSCPVGIPIQQRMRESHALLTFS